VGNSRNISIFCDRMQCQWMSVQSALMIKEALPAETSSDIGEYSGRSVTLSTHHSSAVVNDWYCNTLSRKSGWSGDRIPVGMRFSAPVQTSPGAHLASFTIGTGSFPGVKWPGRRVDNPPHLLPRLKKE